PAHPPIAAQSFSRDAPFPKLRSRIAQALDVQDPGKSCASSSGRRVRKFTPRAFARCGLVRGQTRRASGLGGWDEWLFEQPALIQALARRFLQREQFECYNPAPMGNTIIIKGAREHNLKNIDVEIPRDKLVVITGLSGSGKSSLAFDTIY